MPDAAPTTGTFLSLASLIEKLQLVQKVALGKGVTSLKICVAVPGEFITHDVEVLYPPVILADMTPENFVVLSAPRPAEVKPWSPPQHWAPAIPRPTIVRHYPGFVDIGSDKPEEAEFATTAELLAIPWVAQLVQCQGFHQFSQVKEKPYPKGNFYYRGSLMVEYDLGARFYVVGHIKEEVTLDLPIWVHPYAHLETTDPLVAAKYDMYAVEKEGDEEAVDDPSCPEDEQ